MLDEVDAKAPKVIEGDGGIMRWRNDRLEIDGSSTPMGIPRDADDLEEGPDPNDIRRHAKKMLTEFQYRQKYRRIDFTRRTSSRRNSTTCRTEKMIRAGNQLGKTQSAAAQMTMDSLGLYPDWYKGRVSGAAEDRAALRFHRLVRLHDVGQDPRRRAGQIAGRYPAAGRARHRADPAGQHRRQADHGARHFRFRRHHQR
jgi:hypothetical protein